MNEQLAPAKKSLQPSFTLREIKDSALALTKKHWPHYARIYLVGFFAVAPCEVARIILDQSQGSEMIVALLGMVNTVIQIYFMMVISRYALRASEDRIIPFKQYFSFDGKTLLTMLGASVLYGLLMVGGLILLILPGLIFIIAYSMYIYLILEKNLGAIDALRQSWRMTRGNRENMFLFGFLAANGLALLTVPPFVVASIPIIVQMENAVFISIALGVLAGIWAIIVNVALGAFITIASALMYRKMLATREISA